MTSCEDCPAGKYCPKVNTVDPQSCVPGFDCTGGCKKSTPYLEDDCNVERLTETPDHLPHFICPQGSIKSQYCKETKNKGF